MYMSKIVDETSLVPIIKKIEFDDVAKNFLNHYYPEALKSPMAVPIMTIARKKMGLTVHTDYRLSEDFSILGQMCFNSGYVDVYLKESDEYIQIPVRRGTMFIDPDVMGLRNQGSFNNTVAHECVHWHLHRNYHLLAHVKELRESKYKGCPVTAPDEQTQSKWTDEDWMEWQANGIAPRILMPKDMFIQASIEFRKDMEKTTPTYFMRSALIKELAQFFEVSKQSADIRMQELGIL